jgi:hypothetical protein
VASAISEKGIVLCWNGGKWDYVLMGKLTRMLIKAVCCVTGWNAEELDFAQEDDRGLRLTDGCSQ